MVPHLALEVEARCPEVAWNKNQGLGLALICPHLIFSNNNSTYWYMCIQYCSMSFTHVSSF